MTRSFEAGLLLATIRLNKLILANHEPDSKRVIRVYTAMSSNFIAWLAVTGHFVKSDAAKCAVFQNLQCEVGDNHRDMLFSFAEKCNALPGAGDYQHVAENVSLVWTLLRDPKYRGLRGLAVVATLEHLSLTFIPEIARRAKECGCTDHEYLRVHGEADIAHADALVKAVEVEMVTGYLSAQTMVAEATRITEELVRRIFS